jgi:uncharacterized membrane protein
MVAIIKGYGDNEAETVINFSPVVYPVISDILLTISFFIPTMLVTRARNKRDNIQAFLTPNSNVAISFPSLDNQS